MLTPNDVIKELVATIRACSIAKNEVAEFLQTNLYGNDGVCRYCGRDDVCPVCGACGDDHVLMMDDALERCGGDPAEAIRRLGINMIIMRAGDSLPHGPDTQTSMIYVGNPEDILEGIRIKSKERREELESQEPTITIDDDVWGDALDGLFG